jgi:hypothetical protein
MSGMADRNRRCAGGQPPYPSFDQQSEEVSMITLANAITQSLPTDRSVPYVQYLPQLVAQHDVLAAGLSPEFIAPTGNHRTGHNQPQEHWVPWVSSQSPYPGSVVHAGATVTMQLAVGPIP